MSFTQCLDNASQGGEILFIFMFMKIRVEKVKYKKVKLLQKTLVEKREQNAMGNTASL